jgi:hypothetical protein
LSSFTLNFFIFAVFLTLTRLGSAGVDFPRRGGAAARVPPGTKASQAKKNFEKFQVIT